MARQLKLTALEGMTKDEVEREKFIEEVLSIRKPALRRPSVWVGFVSSIGAAIGLGITLITTMSSRDELVLNAETKAVKAEIELSQARQSLVDVRKALDERKQELDALDEEIRGNEARLASISKELEAERRRLGEIVGQLNEEKTENAELRDKQDQRQEEFDRLRSEMATREDAFRSQEFEFRETLGQFRQRVKDLETFGRYLRRSPGSIEEVQQEFRIQFPDIARESGRD